MNASHIIQNSVITRMMLCYIKYVGVSYSVEIERNWSCVLCVCAEYE